MKTKIETKIQLKNKNVHAQKHEGEKQKINPRTHNEKGRKRIESR